MPGALALKGEAMRLQSAALCIAERQRLGRMAGRLRAYSDRKNLYRPLVVL
jgi:hypothetical protein